MPVRLDKQAPHQLQHIQKKLIWQTVLHLVYILLHFLSKDLTLYRRAKCLPLMATNDSQEFVKQPNACCSVLCVVQWCKLFRGVESRCDSTQRNFTGITVHTLFSTWVLALVSHWHARNSTKQPQSLQSQSLR